MNKSSKAPVLLLMLESVLLSSCQATKQNDIRLCEIDRPRSKIAPIVIDQKNQNASVFDVSEPMTSCAIEGFVCYKSPLPFVVPNKQAFLKRNFEGDGLTIKFIDNSPSLNSVYILTDNRAKKNAYIYSFGTDNDLKYLQVLYDLDGDASSALYERC